MRVLTMTAAGLALLVCSSAEAQRIPEFGGAGYGWTSVGGEWTPLPDSGQITVQDPKVKYVPNNVAEQPTFRYADASNPNLMPWAQRALRRDNQAQDKGFAMYSRSARCWAVGVPNFHIIPARPTYFVQSPDKVVMISETDHSVRHIYMNVPHSANLKPSWYGESVGHYEGDTLVVDTIGQNAFSFLDNFRTPHGPKLHVVERFRVIDDGKAMETEIVLEDPDTLLKPWHVTHRARRVDQPLQESSCAETGEEPIPLPAEPIPRDVTPDF
jgi:hypothetical protein